MNAAKTGFGALLLAAALAVTGPAPATAAVTEAEAAKSVAEAYDVRVLRVREGRIDGREVWLVTVMNPGGDFNEAFMVTTLAVDRQTGELVPAFRHGPSGLLPR